MSAPVHHQRRPGHPDPVIPVLWQLQVSPYFEKVGALDREQVLHIGRTLLPRRRGAPGKRLASTTPVLTIDDRGAG